MNSHDNEDDWSETIHVSNNLRRELMDGYIEPYYKKIIIDSLDARSVYKKIGMVFETVSKLCIAFSSILSFSSGYSENNTQYFAATSGSIGCLSLGLMQVSSFAYKEQSRQSRELNTILKKLKLETIPVERHGSVDARLNSLLENGIKSYIKEDRQAEMKKKNRRHSVYLTNIDEIDEIGEEDIRLNNKINNETQTDNYSLDIATINV